MWHRRVTSTLLIIATSWGHGGVEAAQCWLPPVDASIVEAFRRPACQWCAGNRGVGYGTPAGALVRAVATGRVTFAGSVAGTSYLVVEHANGWRATYGNLTDVTHREGQVVVRHEVVGTTSGPFHFGLRDGDTYIDPTPYLGRPVNRPRLVPVTGDPPPTRGAAVPRCVSQTAISVVVSAQRSLRRW